MHDTSSPSLTCDQAEASAMLTDEPSRAGQQPDQHCSKNCPTNWSGGRPVGGLELGLDQRDLQVAGQTLTGLHQDAFGVPGEQRPSEGRDQVHPGLGGAHIP